MTRLVAFLLIVILSWFLSQPRSTVAAPQPAPHKTSPNTPGIRAASKPSAGSRAAATSDDLTQIVGVGPVWAKLLNELGIRSFKQLAAQNEQELSQRLPGAAAARLQRDGWIGQAKHLAKR